MSPLYRLMLNGLRKIRDEGPVHPNDGICRNLSSTTGEARKAQGFYEDQVERELVRVFRRWDHWSGSYEYPVPAPSGCHTGEFYEARQKGRLWDRTTEYGQLRWQLLDFCIQELEKYEVNQDA